VLDFFILPFSGKFIFFWNQFKAAAGSRLSLLPFVMTFPFFSTFLSPVNFYQNQFVFVLTLLLIISKLPCVSLSLK
jgi:hypothetical protein